MSFHFRFFFFSRNSTGIASSTIGLKVCIITTGIEKCKSIIKKIWKKHDKIVLLAKSKLNNLEVLLSKVLTGSNINHDQLVVIIDVLKEFHDIKEEIKKILMINKLYIKQC